MVEEFKDKGFLLNSIIDKIRSKIYCNQNALKFLNERLLLVEYFDEDFENYKRQFAFRKRNFLKCQMIFRNWLLQIYRLDYLIQNTILNYQLLNNF